MPPVDVAVPEPGGVGGQGGQLAADETATGEGGGTEQAAPRGHRHGEGDQHGQDAGVAGDPGGPRRRQDVELLLLDRHRAGLELLVSRHPGGPGRLVRRHGVVQHVEGGAGRDPPGHEQGLQVTSSDLPLTTGPPAGARHRPEPQQRPGVGQLGPGATRLLHQEQHRGDDETGQQEPQGQQRRAGQRAPGQGDLTQLTSPGTAHGAGGRRPGALPAAGGGGLTDLRLGHDDDAVAGQVGPPAQVDVLGVGREGRLEPVEGAEHVAAHEHARARDGEHVGAVVVLALVGLARDRPTGAAPGAGDRPAHLEQAPVVGPGGELGPGDGDRGRAPGGVEQPVEGLGRRGAVVVQQPQPRSGVGRGAVLLQT